VTLNPFSGYCYWYTKITGDML